MFIRCGELDQRMLGRKNVLSKRRNRKLNIQALSHLGHLGLTAHFHFNTETLSRWRRHTGNQRTYTTETWVLYKASTGHTGGVRCRLTTHSARFIYNQPLCEVALPDSQRCGQSTLISTGEHVSLIFLPKPLWTLPTFCPGNTLSLLHLLTQAQSRELHDHETGLLLLVSDRQNGLPAGWKDSCRWHWGWEKAFKDWPLACLVLV